MAITKQVGRQWALVAEAAFQFDSYTSGVQEAAIDIPVNARVVGGYVSIETAWDSATSATLIVGDGTDDNRYASAVDAKAAGSTNLGLGLGYLYTVKDTIDIQITDVGAPTAGAGRVVVFYTIDDRANEVVPDNS